MNHPPLKKVPLAILFAVFAIINSQNLFGQASNAPLNEDYYHWIDRYEVKAGKVFPQVFTTIKPYRRSDIIDFVDSVESEGLFQSRADRFNRNYLRNDNWEWADSSNNVSNRPFLRHFYRKKSDFFHVNTKDFDLHVNPVIYFGAGNDSRVEDMLFTNTRGIEVRGMVDRKVGFYTYLTDNQAVLPAHVSDFRTRFGVLPHEGFTKVYKEGPGVDFLQARGYISFEATRHINMQFGHDRFFVGNGVRSLAYSDFAPPALFLKTNVKVWKVNYMFLVNQMTANPVGADKGYPMKYTAMHHISMNIGKKFNLGIFESVVFNANDSAKVNQFRIDYLNPIIFYRGIEQQNGSTDNALLGLDFKLNLIKKLSFYGQFLLDEMVISHLRARDGWWANKYAIQVGGKYVDAFGLPNLDLQGEINVVRPFTYSHYTAYGSYSHYRQPIAHPLGANFTEMIGVLRYQPIPKLYLTAKLFLVEIGRDTVGAYTNYGSDITKLNSNRVPNKEIGNEQGQGFLNTIMYGNLTASYQLKHNLFIDASLIIRKSESEIPFYNNKSTISSLALRWNIPQRHYEF
ncbi:MAG TPA: hypothetical protein VGD65_03490 [Chryseosolibacter sp.]